MISWIIVGVGFVFFVFLAGVISYTAGRAKGFEECWKQYVKDYW